MPKSAHLTLRRSLTSLGAFVPFGYMFGRLGGVDPEAIFAIPAVLIGWAFVFMATAILVHVDRFPAQVFVRAVWWANLLFAVLVAVYEPRSGTHLLALSIPCALSILIVGRSGLDITTPKFQPQVFQGTLVAMLIMAAADTCSLLFWGGAAASSNKLMPGIPLLLAAGTMAVACVGLYRLRGWAVFLNLGANIAIATVAGAEALDLPSPIRTLLITTAVGQLLVSAPLIVSVIRGRAPRAPNPRVAPLVGASVVGLLLLISIVYAVGPAGLPSLAMN